jgi:hypothetical protein
VSEFVHFLVEHVTMQKDKDMNRNMIVATRVQYRGDRVEEVEKRVLCFLLSRIIAKVGGGIL